MKTNTRGKENIKKEKKENRYYDFLKAKSKCPYFQSFFSVISSECTNNTNHKQIDLGEKLNYAL